MFRTFDAPLPLGCCSDERASSAHDSRVDARHTHSRDTDAVRVCCERHSRRSTTSSPVSRAWGRGIAVSVRVSGWREKG